MIVSYSLRLTKKSINLMKLSISRLVISAIFYMICIDLFDFPMQ
jgi:hypothetical protein